MDEYQTPVIVFGCGTTLWGIDDQGRDLFWTALGDEVNALAICDVNSDGINEVTWRRMHARTLFAARHWHKWRRNQGV